MKERTKAFALRIIKLYGALPKITEAQVLGKQILRSGTSLGAHYREARRAKSSADFVSKIEGALQELEETCYWVELLGESAIIDSERLKPLHDGSARVNRNSRHHRTQSARKATSEMINSLLGLHPSYFRL